MLDPLEPGSHPGLGAVCGGEQQAGHEELELEPGGGGALELGQAHAHEVGRARELREPEARGLLPHRCDDGVGGVDERLVDSLGHLVQHDEIAQPLEHVGREPARVETGLHHGVDDGEHRGAVAVGERVEHPIEQGCVGEPELGDRVGVREALGPGAGHELTEHRQRVAHRSGTRSGNESEGLGLGRDTLLLADPGQVLLQATGGDKSVRVVVCARADGGQDLVGLGRREHELQVRRRLLDQLEEGVGRIDRELVGLVDDVDLVAARRGGVHRLLAELARVVDTAVARGVHLDHVDRTGTVGREVLAAAALAARGRGGPLLAVQRAGEDARGRGLAAATRTGEQVGVVGAAGVDRSGQRNRDVVLPDDIGQPPRAVGAV